MLKGKTVIVTGSSRGIGFAIAKEFAENHGSRVIICSRDINRAKKASELIKGFVYPAEVDITSNKSVDKLLSEIFLKFDRIDILVNNAGYPFEPEIWYKQAHMVSDDEIDNIFEVDFKGTFRLCRAILPHMVEKGGGVIINMASTPALTGHTEGFPYTIAKASNIALTKHIAREYGTNKIRAYALVLGNIATEATYNSMSEEDRLKASEQPSMKRWGKPEEVARIAACLSSEMFSYATGNSMIIDGGYVLS